MIAIDWYGPYLNLQCARKAANRDYEDGLYVCIGKRAHEKSRKLQYIGIAKHLPTRLVENHHKLKNVTRELEFWLGEIATAEPSGRKMKITPQTLDVAEWLHARFLDIPLNERKKKSLPFRSATVINRWWRKDYETPWKRRPHRDWPDLIDYPELDLPTRLVWFGQKQRLVADA